MRAQLKTVWGENIGDQPLQQYPRPQFVRDSYINLNGWWQYSITDSDKTPNVYQGTILVPFSPESVLSGVNKMLAPNKFLHYKRGFNITKQFNKGIVLLHFGAVDSVCTVYVNGNKAGEHVGGYNSFTLDISQWVTEGDNELCVTVADYTGKDKTGLCYGKQSFKRGGIWYTPQSGIWQTVWIESVAPHYIKSVRIEPLFDTHSVRFVLDKHKVQQVTVVISDNGTEIAKVDSKESEIVVELPQDFKPWTPETPNLYDVTFIARRDKVRSYFGMRKFGIVTDSKGKKRLALNNKPYFHTGVLDQGYWSDGMYTAPSDEAMQHDIKLAKSMGFNMLRKHIKVEPLRWYYHCDRLGMIVWQDMPSGGYGQKKMYTLYLPYALKMRRIKDNKYGKFCRKSVQGRQMFEQQLVEMIDNLYNCVSIATWVPFNEGWGQFDANRITQLVKSTDSTRFVDHASGWHDQGGGDMLSMHVYFAKVRVPRSRKRAVVLSEFGGYSCIVPNHMFNPTRPFGYKMFSDVTQYNNALQQLYARDVLAHVKRGLCASVYTQLSDVEDEINGLVTYDRKIVKVNKEALRQLNTEIKGTEV